MKKALLILGLVCLVALPLNALAESAKPDAKEMAQRQQAANAYWEQTDTHASLIQTLQKLSVQLPPNKQKEFMDRAQKYFNPKRMAEMKKQWVAMAAEVFTAQELKALVAFNGSKEGKAIRGKMPYFSKGNSKIVGGELSAFIRGEQERLTKEAQEAAQKQANPAPAPKAPDKKDKK